MQERLKRIVVNKFCTLVTPAGLWSTQVIVLSQNNFINLQAKVSVMKLMFHFDFNKNSKRSRKEEEEENDAFELKKN